MRSLIVYTHPWDGSFNHYILEKTTTYLKEQGDTVDLIDLHKDQFKPDYTQEDLRLFSRGQYADPLAADYMERLRRAERLVIIFPIWWFGMPAMLKGFFDKVLLKGQAYTEVDHQLKGLLDIQETLILTTGNAPKEFLVHLGDPVKTTLGTGILELIGAKNITWLHRKTVHLPEARTQYLHEIAAYFQK